MRAVPRIMKDLTVPGPLYSIISSRGYHVLCKFGPYLYNVILKELGEFFKEIVSGGSMDVALQCRCAIIMKRPVHAFLRFCFRCYVQKLKSEN